jgi:hypothetical protein
VFRKALDPGQHWQSTQKRGARIVAWSCRVFGSATTCAQALRHRREQDAMIAKLIKIATCDRLRNISPGETLASSLAHTV